MNRFDSLLDVVPNFCENTLGLLILTLIPSACELLEQVACEWREETGALHPGAGRILAHPSEERVGCDRCVGIVDGYHCNRRRGRAAPECTVVRLELDEVA